MGRNDPVVECCKGCKNHRNRHPFEVEVQRYFSRIVTDLIRPKNILTKMKAWRFKHFPNLSIFTRDFPDSIQFPTNSSKKIYFAFFGNVIIFSAEIEWVKFLSSLNKIYYFHILNNIQSLDRFHPKCVCCSTVFLVVIFYTNAVVVDRPNQIKKIVQKASQSIENVIHYTDGSDGSNDWINKIKFSRNNKS